MCNRYQVPGIRYSTQRRETKREIKKKRGRGTRHKAQQPKGSRDFRAEKRTNRKKNLDKGVSEKDQQPGGGGDL